MDIQGASKWTSVVDGSTPCFFVRARSDRVFESVANQFTPGRHGQACYNLDSTEAAAVGKAWYNFFLVTDDQRGDAAPPTAASPDAVPAGASRRVADLVPEGGAGPSFTGPVTNLTALEDIYRSARIAAPAHGYTVLKVAEMLQSEHIRTLPADVKRKSILVALDAAGVKVDEIVEDAVHRDRALDTYERVLEKNLDDLRTEKQTENARLEQEVAQRLAELRARMEENNQSVFRELENLRAWQSRKQDEERRIAEAMSYFVSENPITTTTAGPPAHDKGDTRHVRQD